MKRLSAIALFLGLMAFAVPSPAADGQPTPQATAELKSEVEQFGKKLGKVATEVKDLAVDGITNGEPAKKTDESSWQALKKAFKRRAEDLKNDLTDLIRKIRND